jgi:small ligand-binding sensory domain FIST
MATGAGSGLSNASDPLEAAGAAAGAALERLGAGAADWGLVFATMTHRPHYAAILAEVQKSLGTPTIAGCSGAGVLACGEELEHGPGVAVLAVRSDRFSARAHLEAGGDDMGRVAARDLGRRVAPGGGLLVTLPDPFAIRPDVMLQEIDALLPGTTVVGGASGGGPRALTTFQFCGRNVATRSLAALHMTGSLRTGIGITQGCLPLGPACRVTRAAENLLLELDGRPALGVLRERLPAALADSLERLGGHLFVGLPPDDGDAISPGEYLVRPLVAIDPDRGALLLGVDVKEGSPMLIVLRDGVAARDDLKAMLERLSGAGARRDWSFGMYFNCAGRGSALYGLSGVDSAFIGRQFGDLPLVGFFGNAEIAPLRGRNQLFTYTGVLVLCGDGDGEARSRCGDGERAP